MANETATETNPTTDQESGNEGEVDTPNTANASGAQGDEAEGEADAASTEGESSDDEAGDEPPTLDRDDAPSWALSEIRRLRAENAARRTKFKEATAEITKAQEALTDLKTTAETATSLLRENVALKFSLPDELAKVLNGKTREEMEAHAAELQPFAFGGGLRRRVSGGLNPSDGGGDDVQAAVQRARARRGVI